MTRLHVVSVPWADPANTFCGHSSMTARFATMCHQHGHEVLLYAGPTNDAECKEHIPLVSPKEQHEWFPNLDNLATIPGLWDTTSRWWETMNVRATKAISERAQPDDLVCVIGGDAQQPLAQLPLRTIEYAVGYQGAFSDYRCYASNAWRSYLHGKEGQLEGRFFDTVIPHFFDPDDFHLAPKDDYLLYLGRVNVDKGVWIANDIAQRTGRRLLVAGQGDPTLCPDGEYLGTVTTEQRADLLARAHAVLVPSHYMEPFGSVVVEAMLSGTPVITTDWGSFPELVENGVTGFRCCTLTEFCDAVENLGTQLTADEIRQYAINRFSMNAVGPRYTQWFDRLALLNGSGWYSSF